MTENNIDNEFLTRTDLMLGPRLQRRKSNFENSVCFSMNWVGPVGLVPLCANLRKLNLYQCPAQPPLLRPPRPRISAGSILIDLSGKDPCRHRPDRGRSLVGPINPSRRSNASTSNG
jgi:hypothetical protein